MFDIKKMSDTDFGRLYGDALYRVEFVEFGIDSRTALANEAVRARNAEKKLLEALKQVQEAHAVIGDRLADIYNKGGNLEEFLEAGSVREMAELQKTIEDAVKLASPLEQ